MFTKFGMKISILGFPEFVNTIFC